MRWCAAIFHLVESGLWPSGRGEQSPPLSSCFLSDKTKLTVSLSSCSVGLEQGGRELGKNTGQTDTFSENFSITGLPHTALSTDSQSGQL